MDFVIAIADANDPFMPGLLAHQEQAGPLIAFLRQHPADHCVLFLVPPHAGKDEVLVKALDTHFPKLTCEIRPLALRNPADSEELREEVRQEVLRLLGTCGADTIRVCCAEGHSTYQPLWQKLIEAGDLYAHLYTVRLPLLPLDAPLIREMRLPAAMPMAVHEDLAPQLEYVIEETGCIGNHPAYLQALDAARSLATHDGVLLLRGEAGTGRENLARLIHRLSERRSFHFVPVNCNHLPSHYLESVLFGHVRGAFVWARQDDIGKFGLAHLGVLYIYNVEVLPASIQEALVRYLREGCVRPHGSDQTRAVDARLILGTELSPSKALRLRNLIPELHELIADREIVVPALRERRSDLPMLALHILARINRSLRHPKRISREALRFVEEQMWSRNLHDLRAAIERAALYAQDEAIEPADLTTEGGAHNIKDLEVTPLPEFTEDFALDIFMSELRNRILRKALEEARGNQSEAARLLKISPQAVHQYLKRTK